MNSHKQTFEELIALYPDEDWKERITQDVVNILTTAGLSIPFNEDACLQWLHDNGESSLKSGIDDLAVRFKAHSDKVRQLRSVL